MSSAGQTNQTTALEVRLTLAPSVLPEFTPWLHKGVEISFEAGGAINDLLCAQLGVDPEYLAQKIQTIFLDYKVVDQADQALLHDGCILALSAALPGLAGASLRKGGILKSLRSGISYAGDQAPEARQKARMTLKLFNLLIKDLGPAVLRHGILMGKDSFREFLRARGEEFWKQCQQAQVDGRDIPPGDWAGLGWLNNGGEVELKVALAA